MSKIQIAMSPRELGMRRWSKEQTWSPSNELLVGGIGCFLTAWLVALESAK